MSQDAEKTKRLVAFKEKVAKRAEELESELKDTRAMLEMIDSVLIEKGFKRAVIKESITMKASQSKTDKSAEPSQADREPETISENVIPLSAATGELLALIHVTDDILRVLPTEDKSFSINTPPFTNFLVERVLSKMQERDNELAKVGQLSTDKIFSYTIVKEGDIIREISIRNVDSERLRELKSSIRWTLEKMYEKMKS